MHPAVEANKMQSRGLAFSSEARSELKVRWHFKVTGKAITQRSSISFRAVFSGLIHVKPYRTGAGVAQYELHQATKAKLLCHYLLRGPMMYEAREEHSCLHVIRQDDEGTSVCALFIHVYDGQA